MNEADIENAIKARIAGASLSWPIAWPNQDMPAPSPLPRLHVALDRVERTTPTLGPETTLSRGLVRVLCIVRAGTSTKAVNEKAFQVAQLFQKADILAISNGRVICTDAADIRAGFRDGDEWVVPVIAKYTAIPA